MTTLTDSPRRAARAARAAATAAILAFGLAGLAACGHGGSTVEVPASSAAATTGSAAGGATGQGAATAAAGQTTAAAQASQSTSMGAGKGVIGKATGVQTGPSLTTPLTPTGGPSKDTQLCQTLMSINFGTSASPASSDDLQSWGSALTQEASSASSGLKPQLLAFASGLKALGQSGQLPASQDAAFGTAANFVNVWMIKNC
ncbi:MAG: hypothetical protein LBM66_04875 [Bifidobacteriaceae bacterium]|jgi:hypothetical protein|nr:hypothetical protein [Bifidobacteriaceae bacterium]